MLSLKGRNRSLLVVLGFAVMLFAFLMIGLNATSLADPLGLAFASGAKPAAIAAPANAAPAAVPTGKSTIGDYVWHDYNLDGLYNTIDESEYLAGFNGVKVNLYLKDPVSGLWGLITTTVTGDNPNMVRDADRLVRVQRHG